MKRQLTLRFNHPLLAINSMMLHVSIRLVAAHKAVLINDSVVVEI